MSEFNYGKKNISIRIYRVYAVCRHQPFPESHFLPTTYSRLSSFSKNHKYNFRSSRDFFCRTPLFSKMEKLCSLWYNYPIGAIHPLAHLLYSDRCLCSQRIVHSTLGSLGTIDRNPSAAADLGMENKGLMSNAIFQERF